MHRKEITETLSYFLQDLEEGKPPYDHPSSIEGIPEEAKEILRNIESIENYKKN